MQEFSPFGFDPWANIHPTGDKMTALVSCYTSEGFIVGADGKGSSPNAAPTFDRKKIFEGRNNENLFVWSLSGLTLCQSLYSSYDFVEQCQRLIVAHQNTAYETPDSYVDAISRDLKRSMEESRAVTFIDFPSSPDNQTESGFLISRLTFAGYFAGIPFLKIALIRHKDQKVNMDCEIKNGEMWIGHPEPVEGPHPITLEFLSKGDERLSKYRNDLVRPYANSLEAAFVFLKAYLDCCCDPVTQELAKQFSEHRVFDGIGRSVHIAEIKPDGIKWRIAPLSVSI